MFLIINLISKQACDEFPQQRGGNWVNLYHAIEFAHYDYLQLGQYAMAKKMMSRMEKMILKLGAPQANSQTKLPDQHQLIWRYQRMEARQLLESVHGDYVFEDKFSVEEMEKRYQLENISDADIIYTATSVNGMLLLRVIHEAKFCSEDKKNSCNKNKIMNWAIKKSKKLIENLESRKSIFYYTKASAKMLNQVFLGIKDIAEYMRPHGLKCLTQKTCIARKKKLSEFSSKILKGPLKKATKIQKDSMIRSSVTPTLLYMPSFEIYGYILLVLEKYQEAKEIFETSLDERMGRTLSLLGLARSHAMLGNKKHADYFYQYLRTQLKDSDQENMVVKEAENWSETSKSSWDDWFWPYYLY